MALGSLLGTLGAAGATANPVGMGIAAGAGLLKAGLGFLQQAKGKKMLKKTVDPGYVIPKGYEQNLGQAEQMAKSGLSPQEYNLASTNIQRGSQAGLRQLGRMSNPFAGIAGLARSQSDSFSKLDASNASAKRQNILQAMGARREMAGQQLAQQQYSQNRYFDKVNEAQARIGAGTQNMFGGISDIGSAGIMASLGGGKRGSVVSDTEGIGSYTGNIGKNLSTGQFGTRMGGIQGGGFGSGMLPGLPFIPRQIGKFIPKTFPSNSEDPYNP
jgi:hypothetical protein